MSDGSNVSLSHEELQAAAGDVRSRKDELKGFLRQASTTVEQVTGRAYRTRTASPELRAAHIEWNQATGQLVESLGQVADGLEETRRIDEQTDQQARGRVGEIRGGGGGGNAGGSVAVGSGVAAGGGAAAAAGAAARSSGSGSAAGGGGRSGGAAGGGGASGSGGGRSGSATGGGGGRSGGGGAAGGGGSGSAGMPARSGEAGTQPGGGTPSGGAGSHGSRPPASDSASMRDLSKHVFQSNPSGLPGTCAHGTVAFANRYQGAWNRLTIAPPYRTHGACMAALERYFGTTSWYDPTRAMDVHDNLALAGHGSQGILFGVRGDRTGHVFNMINYRDQVLFVDTQCRWTAEVNPRTSARMMRAYGYDLVFYLPVLPWVKPGWLP
jgi:uncharacterized protein YukE